MNRGGLGARALNAALQARAEPGTAAAARRALRLDLRSGRQGHPDCVNDYDKEVFNGDIGRITRDRPRRGRSLTVDFDGPPGPLRDRRARRARPRLRHQRPQGPGLGVPGRGHPAGDPALHPAAAQPALHRRHPRQAAGGAGRLSRKALAMAVKQTGARAVDAVARSGWWRGEVEDQGGEYAASHASRGDCAVGARRSDPGQWGVGMAMSRLGTRLTRDSSTRGASTAGRELQRDTCFINRPCALVNGGWKGH